MHRSSNPSRRVLAAVASITFAACAVDSRSTRPEDLAVPASQADSLPVLNPVYYSYAFGTVSHFALHGALGFEAGIPDGSLGALATGGTPPYTFFGSGHNAAGQEGVYTMTGSLTTLSSSSSTSAPLLQPGALASAGATGWNFDRDYAGGGQLVPVTAKYNLLRFLGTEEQLTVSNVVMPYHGEFHFGTDSNNVPCYYGGIGLAVRSATADGNFTPIGQAIQIQPARPAACPTAGNTGNAFGSMILADGSGVHLQNPPAADQVSDAYFYLFYQDVDPNGGKANDSNPGFCQSGCLAVARASYSAVVAQVSPNPQDIDTLPETAAERAIAVASLFSKYYADSGTATWTQPGTSGTPDNSAPSGNFTPLFKDEGGIMPSVLFDSTSGQYLLAFQAASDGTQNYDASGICIRTSTDLIHWSPSNAAPGASPPACAAPFYRTSPDSSGTARMDVYPTLIGDTGDPLTGGAAPVVFYQNFPVPSGTNPNAFPVSGWSVSELDSIPVNVTGHRLGSPLQF
jgi:hypothetical protein